MSDEEAGTAIVYWLRMLGVKLADAIFVKVIGADSFRIGLVQVAPEPKRRVFEMTPLEVADCYEVKEVA